MASVSDRRTLIEQQEKRRRARKEYHRWVWAIACFAAILGTIVFSWFALNAFAHGTASSYGLGFLSVACFVLSIIAYPASKYHTYSD